MQLHSPRAHHAIFAAVHNTQLQTAGTMAAKSDIALLRMHHLSQPVQKKRKRFRLSRGKASTVRQKACSSQELSGPVYCHDSAIQSSFAMARHCSRRCQWFRYSPAVLLALACACMAQQSIVIYAPSKLMKQVDHDHS